MKSKHEGDTLTVLSSRGPVLTKRWTTQGITPYDRAKTFSFEERAVEDIRSLSEALQELEREPRKCVIRGKPGPNAAPDKTTRDLEHFSDTPRRWVCLDVDSWDLPARLTLDDPAAAVSEFIASNLPDEFQEVTHHWQLSSSAGAPGKERVLKAHIWFWLSEPRSGHELEAWARALQVPVDVTVFRTVQIHYTAAPVVDAGVTCPIERRSGLTEGLLADSVDLVTPQNVDKQRPERAGRLVLVDPRQKPGLIGIFCSLYPPARVVDEILPDVFEWEGDSPSRLNWLQGGGATGGAVITDDELRIYNSHATDPFEGHAQNMWDLVRHYKFGELDSNIDPTAVDWLGPAGMPSHQAMSKWVMELDDVAEEAAALNLQRQEERQVKEEEKRHERIKHLETLKERVQGCADVEALKEYVQTLREDALVDDTDRAGALTVVVQQRFKDLGSPQKRDDVRKMLKPTGGWSADSGSPSGPEWLSRWVYVKSEGVFFSLDRKAALDSRAFDAEHTDKMPLRNGTISLRERASEYAVHAWAIRTVDRTIYAPPEGEIFEQDKATYVNLYDPDSAPACEPGGEAAVRMVMSHLERMLPDQRERELFLSWMAHVVRHPGKKVRWAPYIYGVEGAGKSFLADLLEWVMGAPNIRRVAGRDLVSDFTGWAAGRALTVVEEAHQTGHRYDVGEVLKAPVTNDRISVHKKGVDPYEIVNYVSYLVLSNHADGIPITETDRRYFFLQSAIGTEAARALSEEGFYNNLFAVCKASRGQLRRWLIEDVQMHPEFDPNGRAPVTEARARVIELTKTDAQAAVEELLAGRKAVTSSHVHAHLESLGTDIRTSRLGNLIGSAGFVFFKKMRIGEGTSRVWVRPGEIRGGDESEVRNALSWCLSDDF